LSTIITINGIEESISNLQYRNKSALKYQLVHAIRDFYRDEKSTETLQAIDGDQLIQRLWQIDSDPIALKNKRKNLNSIKSTINTDLRKLYQEGLNPEGIVIGPANVFIMSEEAKEAAFETFRSTMEKTGSIDLGKMLEVLNIINESLSNVEGIIAKEGSSAAEKMNELKSLIRGLSGKVNLERSFLEQSPGKIHLSAEQAVREFSEESPIEGIRKSEDSRTFLRELSDFPEPEEFEPAGEVFEQALEQAEMPQWPADAQPQTAELSGDELDHLDEMAIEEQPVAEQEIIEDDAELGAESAEPEEKDEIEIAAEPVPVEAQTAETDEFEADAELETEELSTEEVEITDDTDFIAEEMAEEPVLLADEEDVPAEIETEELIVEEETGVATAESDAEIVAEEIPEPAESIEVERPESAEEEALILETPESDSEEEIQDEDTDLIETELVETELPTEAAAVFSDPEIEKRADAVDAEFQEPFEELPETEETEAIGLSEDEALAEEEEPELGSAGDEIPADLDDLEAVEALPELEEILEEANEDVEELDLEEAGEPEVAVLSEADQEEEIPEPETVSSSFEESAALAGEIPEECEEPVHSLEEDEPTDAFITEQDPTVAEETEIEPESEDDSLLEPLEGLEWADEEEIVPEAEEIAADELEEVAGVEAETASMEPSADEILEEVEEDSAEENAVETEEDDFIEVEATGDELSVGAEESEAAPAILPEGLLGADETDLKTNAEKARYLAEDFNDSLAAMDKFHNQYILIPQGRYVIGSRPAQSGAQAERVKELPDFYMGKFPVTNALFEIFIEKTGYKTTAEKRGFGLVYYPRWRQTKNERSGLNTVTYRSALVSESVQGACWYQPSGPGSTLHHKRNHPVVQVSLEDALSFAAWTGKRLPREEEWEAAGRGAKGRIYPWGSRWKKGACNVEESDLGDTAPVEFYMTFANEFGLADLLGNVLEWTADAVEENGRRNYVVKGGSWISKPGVRLTERLKLEKETCSNILGFRCVAY